MAPSDPVVLITGATGPLGRAAARAFGADGARLGLVGTNLGRLDALAADIELVQDRWVPAEADLSDGTAAARAVRTVTDRFGPIDVLLHLVGGWVGGTDLAELDPTVLGSMIDKHVWSTFHVARTVVPGMTDRGWGRILVVSSTTTTAPGPRSAAYTAAKTAQEALIRVLAREVAGNGVTANIVAVATIDVEHERESAPTARNARWTTPEEIVATFRFLCSDAGATINGARIALDGRG